MSTAGQTDSERGLDRRQGALQSSPALRRIFVVSLAGIALAVRTTSAQRALTLRRIGLLEVGTSWKEGITAALRERGWSEGKNLVIEQRHARGRIEALPALAEELVREHVEAIVAIGPNPTNAAMRATKTIPVVFSANDAVINGFVTNLARPGGNATGFSTSTTDLHAKTCALLKEAKPDLRRFCLLEIVGNPQFRVYRPAFEDSCSSLGIVPTHVSLDSAARISVAIAEASRERAEALLLVADSFTSANRAEIISAALRARIAPIGGGWGFARDGALLSLSELSDGAELGVADYVDRILRGADPAELPVQQPTRFELIVNLRTAASMGIAIPRSLIVQASEVIQ